MQLELAIVEACGPSSCRVRPVVCQASLEAPYAAPVLNAIRIRSGDLVALDRAVNPPELVWRWHRGRVESVNGDTAVVSRRVTGDPDKAGTADIEAQLAVELRGTVQAGDAVFLTHEASGVVVMDAVRDGLPASAARIQEAYFPEIIATYARLNRA